MTSASEDEPKDGLQMWLELLQTSTSAVGPAADDAASGQFTAKRRIDSVGRCLRLLDEMWPAAEDSVAGDYENSVGDKSPREDGRFDESVDARSDRTTIQDGRPKRFGRFLIGERLGRGGQSVVFRALDPVLNRDVALKIPRPDSLASAERRRRFVDEARVLARLQHPHLVSILEAGSVGPVCYLVTPYCPGPSLAEWIDRHEESVDFELAAGLVRDLAAAVDYVHSRGILHRDIKPSNVLLEPLEIASAHGYGQFGFTPKLTDFGLAKLTQNPVEQTATGTVLGTPAYMAPEQAEGRQADIGVATDVYALGATLYALLTGRPPYCGGSELQTLRLITEGSLPPPRRIRPCTPSDLEAICLKCLDPEPGRRYHSARDLADDLTAYLEQRPIQARPCGPLKRALKWSRRRPLVAALAASLLVSMTLGLATASWQWLRAEGHRETAEQNFLLAHEAVKQFHELLFEKDAFDTPELLPLRDEVLQTALPYYDRLLAQQTTSSEIRADIADVYYQLGQAALTNDHWKKSLGFYRKAAELRRELAQEDPANSEHREFLATICQRIGSILHGEYQSPEAIEWLEEAAAMQQQLVNKQPQQMGPKTALVETLNSLVRVYLARDNLKAASEAASQAAELCRSVPPQSDTRPSVVQRYRAEAYISLCRVHSASGDAHAAVEACCRAIELQQDLVAEDLEMPTAASRLAVSLDLLASLYARMGNDEQAVEEFVQAIEALEKISERYPAVGAYQRKLAETSYRLAIHHRSQGRDDDALKRHQQASQLWERLLSNHPENAGLRYDLMRAYHRMAKIHLLGERFEEAAATANRGMDLFHDRPPKADRALAENKYISLGAMYQKLGRIETRVTRELEQR